MPDSLPVAFDASHLCVGYARPELRSGVFRVVERLAHGLSARPDCDLRFVAPGSFETLRDLIDYLRGCGLGARAPRRPFGLDLQVQVERLRRAERLRTTDPSNASRMRRRVTNDLLWKARQLLSLADGVIRGKADDDARLYHSTFGPLPECRPGVARILTVHDLIPIRHPEFVPDAVRRSLVEIIASVRDGDHLLCVSEFVRNDVCEYLNVDRSATSVVYWAADEKQFQPVHDAAKIADVRSRYGIPDGPYFLSVATLEPRRNIRHLVASFSTLIAQEPSIKASLVLAGHAAWPASELIAGGDTERGTRVVVTGFVADEDLATLYSGAVAFVYPSLADGFGLTVLEAMQCGSPTIVSSASSLPEVVGTAGLVVDPHDGEALCQAMFSVARDANLRSRLAESSLVRAREFSWDRTTETVMRCYRSVVQ